LILVPSSILLTQAVQSKSIIITDTQAFTPSQILTEPIVIDDETDFVALGATGVGTRSDPYVLDDLVMTTIGTCITVTGTTAFFMISNCILESDPTEPAVQFNDVENGQVDQCEIVGGSSGIQVLSSIDCSITNTSIYECWIGIQMDLVSNCTIAYARIFNNHRGLLFDSGEFIRIENNTIFSNTENGLEFAWGASNNTVVRNEIGWNGVDDQNPENAVDHGEDNHFDDGTGQGNEWSDFNGTTPYLISGTSGTNDSYPTLLEDNIIPVIVDVADTAIDVETTGNILTWIVRDDYPDRYTIEIDGNLLSSSSWSGDPITVNLDPLDIGSYVYDIRVYDAIGNIAGDTVNINVVSFVLGGIGTELVMIASGLTVAIFLVVMLIIKKLS